MRRQNAVVNAGILCYNVSDVPNRNDSKEKRDTGKSMRVFKIILLLLVMAAAAYVFFVAEIRPFSSSEENNPLDRAASAGEEEVTETYQIPEEHTVRFVYGEKEYYSERVPEGRTLRADVVPSESTFLGWLDEQGEYCDVAELTVLSDRTFTASVGPELKQNPKGFFAPEPDGLFYPDRELTRSDIARVLYKLLAKDPGGSIYISDLHENAKCYKAAVALTANGYMQLTGDRFRPDEAITVTELEDLLSQMFNGKRLEELLPADRETITRGEAAVLLCALLGLDRELPADQAAYYPDVSVKLDCHKAVSIAGEQSLVWAKAGEKLDSGYRNVDGWLYFVDEDGYFVRNAKIGTLEFGEDGRFTSGNEELDTFVAEKIDALTNKNMARETMLYEVYKYVRDRNLYLKGSYYRVGETGWEIEEALKLFRNGRGNCYSFAAQMWALARGLGYDAKAISGFISHTYQPHGWVEIEIDGTMYVFDAEQEGLYYRAREDYNTNMFKMTYEVAAFWSYIRTPEEAAAAGIEGYVDEEPEDTGETGEPEEG